MAIFLRGETWWHSFEFRGREVRGSCKTKNKRNAQRYEEKRRKELWHGHTGIEDSPKAVSFGYAAADLIEFHPKWKPRTKQTHQTSLQHLLPVFGTKLLEEITPKLIAKYQVQRQGEKGKNGLTLGRTVNIEVALIRLVLIKHKMWERIKDEVLWLDENEDVGRALRADEIVRLLNAAKASSSRSLFPALVVSINTGLRNEELRLLKWGQIDLAKPEIRVGKSKTKGGTGRNVNLNDWAVEVLTEWRSRFPNAKPEHYVFPSESYSLVGKPGQYGGDVKLGRVYPNKAVSTWKTSWTTARKNAGVECRWHDLRHTCASLLGEAGARDRTLQEILGWMSPRMIARYSHVSNADKQAAVNAIPRPQLQLVQ